MKGILNRNKNANILFNSPELKAHIGTKNKVYFVPLLGDCVVPCKACKNKILMGRKFERRLQIGLQCCHVTLYCLHDQAKITSWCGEYGNVCNDAITSVVYKTIGNSPTASLFKYFVWVFLKRKKENYFPTQ
uniref:Uncharacterized protein n=1 Tax=Cacopsylla melanoneura TaxID=428564 RepID=A0A8D8YD22_9HEMI